MIGVLLIYKLSILFQHKYINSPKSCFRKIIKLEPINMSFRDTLHIYCAAVCHVMKHFHPPFCEERHRVYFENNKPLSVCLYFLSFVSEFPVKCHVALQSTKLFIYLVSVYNHFFSPKVWTSSNVRVLCRFQPSLCKSCQLSMPKIAKWRT